MKDLRKNVSLFIEVLGYIAMIPILIPLRRYLERLRFKHENAEENRLKIAFIYKIITFSAPIVGILVILVPIVAIIFYLFL